MWRVRFLLMLLLMFACPMIAFAAIRYASPTGGQSAPCTTAPPAASCTAATAISQAMAGDTVYFRGGTYTATLPWSSRSGTNGSPIIYSGYQGEAAIFTRNAVISTYANSAGVHDLVLTQMIFDGSTITEEGFFIWSDTGAGGPVTRITLDTLEIRNWTGQGIHSAFATNLIVRRSKIHHNGRDCAILTFPCRAIHGAYMANPGLLLEDNDWYENSGYGIQIYNEYGSSANGTIIRGNRIYNNHGDGGVVLGGGASGLPDKIDFYNNSVYNNDAGGLYGVSYGCTNCLVANNTFYGNGPAPAIEIGGNGGAFNTQVVNNIVANNQSGISNLAGGSTTFTTNSCTSNGTGCDPTLTGNPGFVSAAGGDFHLNAAGSPAIGTGQNLSSSFTTDAGHAARPPTGPWDLGLYMFEPGTVITPDPPDLQVFLKGAGNALDSSTHGRNATIVGGVATNGAPLVGADPSFVFNGTTGYLTLPNDSVFRPPSLFCISTWVNSTGTGDYGYLWDMLGYGLLHDPLGGLRGYLISGATFLVVAPPSNILNGTTHHVVYTKDALGLRMYLDGAEIGFMPTTADVTYSGSPAPVIGRNGANAQEYFGGRMAYIRFYNQTCDATAVQNLFNENVPVAGMSIAHTAWFTPGVPNPSSQLGATDTNRVNHLITTPLAWRFAVRKADAGSVTEYFKPMCIINTGAGFPAWTSAVELTNSFGAQGLRYYADATITQGQATSVLLPLDGFTAAAGKILISPIDTTSPYDAAQRATISQGQQIELQYEVEFGSPLVGGEAVMCRLVRENGADLNSYANIMQVSLQGITPPTSLSVGGVDQGGTRQ